MKLSHNALNMLQHAYRAIYSRAFIKGLKAAGAALGLSSLLAGGMESKRRGPALC